MDAALITPAVRQNLIPFYQEAYGEKNLFFPPMYDGFDLVANKIGETAATGLIHSLLSNDDPALNFLTIILDMCTIDHSIPTKPILWKLSPKTTKELANLSFEEACDVFNNAIDALNLDDEITHSHLLHISVAAKEWNNDEDVNGFMKFLLGAPKACLFSTYSENTNPFLSKSELEIAEEVEYGNFFIVLEAIRQQLTQGNGLLCPFWLWSPGACCGGRNRELLESVWRCTKPDRSRYERWERMGCLNEKAVARRKRKAQNLRANI